VIGTTVESKRTEAAGRLCFGRLLADALKGRRMKQEDLARSLGTTQSSISGWINGKYEPSAATVFTIERALGLDPGSLSRPLGYLPVEPAARTISVDSAIAQCVTLDEEAKAVLSSLYRVLSSRSSAPPAAILASRQLSSSKRERLAGPAPAEALPHSVASGH
jgi:transcriptional regulator with XRE-family HTH domain